MQQSLYEKHKHCDVAIHMGRKNPFGSPALVCAQHFDKKNRLQWIDWLNEAELNACIQLGIPQIHTDPSCHYRENSVRGNFFAYLD
jgi:hypothetical protein